MSVSTFRNNAAITATAAVQTTQAIAYTTITAAVITADRTRAAWAATAHHRRTAYVIARATYAGVKAAAPHAGRAVLHLIAVVISIAVLAYRRGRQFRAWLDALVAECEAEAPAQPTIEPEIEPITQPEPTPNLTTLTARELRRLAQSAGMPAAARARKSEAIAWLSSL